MDIGDFLQFQRSFHSHCIIQTTTNDESIFSVRIFLCNFSDPCIHLQHFFRSCGQFMQFFHCCLECGFCHRAANLCKMQGDQIQDGNLCSISLCGSNRDFGAGPCIDHIITFSGNGATNYVYDGNDFQALSLCFSQGSQCICCFTTLADDDAQFSFIQDRISVSEFRSDIHFHGDSCHFFHHISANDTGMHSCTAGYDMDSAAVFDFLFCQGDLIQFDICFCQTGLDGFIQHFGLLHDLLHHEVVIAAFFCRCDIPCYMIDFFFDFIAVYIEQCHAFAFQHSDLMFIQQVIISCVFQQSGNIRCDIVFAFTQTNQERAAFTYSYQCVGVFAAHDTQCVCTTDHTQQFSCGGDHIPVIQVFIQMCYHFCICFGFEYNTFCFQCFFQFQIVFDDTIVYHGNFAAHAVMRVAVCFTGLTVGCPTGVTDTDMGRFLTVFFQLFRQTGQSAFHLDGTDPIFIYGNTCRVIPAVFQFGQAVQQYGYCLIAANISYDSAHRFFLHFKFIRPLPFFCRER